MLVFDLTSKGTGSIKHLSHHGACQLFSPLTGTFPISYNQPSSRVRARTGIDIDFEIEVEIEVEIEDS